MRDRNLQFQEQFTFVSANVFQFVIPPKMASSNSNDISSENRDFKKTVISPLLFLFQAKFVLISGDGGDCKRDVKVGD